jgi:membrane-associated phospholipid phosphatase
MRWGRLLLGTFMAFGGLAGIARAQDPESPPAGPPEPTVQVPTPTATPQPAPRRIGANDKRRTLRSYAANLAYNTVGVLTTGNRFNLITATGLAGVAQAYDSDVAGYFHDHPHDQFGKIGQAMGGGLVVGVATLGAFSLGRISPWDRFRASTYDLSQAVLINLSYVFVIKEVAHRERPDGSDNLSFPSGHASDSFAIATVVERHYGWKAGVPAYAVATFIAASRMAAEKHFLSDVAFGAAFGFGVGRTVVRRNNRPPTPPGVRAPHVPPPKTEKKTELRLFPASGPSGDGVGFTFSLAF